jgi:hypothetical protein
LIKDWDKDDDWAAWRSFISAIFVQPFGSDEEQHIFQECTRLEASPATGFTHEVPMVECNARTGN